MIEPDATPDPNENGEQVKLTISMYRYQREWIEQNANDRDMNLSEYMRSMVNVGERQLVAIENVADEDGRNEIEAELIGLLPDEEVDAIDPDEVIATVTDPIEETIYQILKTNSRIQYSPQHEGYYLE